jgi:UDP-N-acetylmuramoyl-tripeptide--D-alanyl-D-alanine ligase
MKKILIRLYTRFLHWCARRYIARIKPIIIGITGSVGKTTAREIITQTIQHTLTDIDIYTSPKNFNGDIGFALSVLRIDSFSPSILGYLHGAWQALIATASSQGPDVMVLEYGIDYSGEMAILLSIVPPDIAIITAIDAVHGDHIGSPTDIANQKRLLIDHARDIAFLNQDDPYILQMADRTAADVIRYSINQPATNEQIGYQSYQMTADTDHHVVSQVNATYGRNCTWTGTTNMLSKAFASYLSIGIAIADTLAQRNNHTIQLPNHIQFAMQPGRLSLYQGIHDSLIVDSTYNAAPASMRHMLGVAYRIRHDVYTDARPMIGIIGDMRELGDLTEYSHRQLAAITSQGLDYIVLVGESVRYTIDELEKVGYNPDQVYHASDAHDAGHHVVDLLSQPTYHQSIIFAKGSQNTIYLEEAITHLLADVSDRQHLPRQESRRITKKNNHFGL